jgi:ankyrin repeat protein
MNKKEQKELNKELIDASKEGNLELVQFVISKGANIHDQDDYVLRLASSYGYLEIVKYLVENGADIHADNNFALI